MSWLHYKLFTRCSRSLKYYRGWKLWFLAWRHFMALHKEQGPDKQRKGRCLGPYAHQILPHPWSMRPTSMVKNSLETTWHDNERKVTSRSEDLWSQSARLCTQSIVMLFANTGENHLPCCVWYAATRVVHNRVTCSPCSNAGVKHQWLLNDEKDHPPGLENRLFLL